MTRTVRMEFDKAAQVGMLKRATRENGVTYCEECGLPVKKWQFDHTLAEALRAEKRAKRKRLTENDGRLLCEPCHAIKTGKDVAAIAEAKAREASALGARKPGVTKKIQSAGFAPAPEKPRSDRVAKVDKAELPPLPRRSLFA